MYVEILAKWKIGGFPSISSALHLALPLLGQSVMLFI